MNSKDNLKVGILPYRNLFDDLEGMDVVYNNVNDDIPTMDVCFIDNSIDSQITEKIRDNADILVSLGSNTNLKADLIIPGTKVSDDLLIRVVTALINNDSNYLDPLFEMTKENDFKKNIMITVNNELCTGCSGCAFICPVEAIEMKNTRPEIDFTNCIHCGSCFLICPKSWNLHEEVEAWC